MISVLDHIEYLTHKHDCVIVPGFGAFISRYSCVKYNGMISAINRNISFNASVDYNDGLLISSLMRREQISAEIAKNIINDFVCCIRKQLVHEGEIPVGRLGYFKLVEDDVLEFNPFITQKNNNEFFGLSSLSLKPLSDDVVNDDLGESENAIVPFTKKILQVAASIVLLIGLSLFLSTPIIEDDNTNYANINAFSMKNHVKEQTMQDLYIAIPNIDKSKDKVTREIQDISNNDVVDSRLEEKGKYCIVIASLATEKQAEKFIQECGIQDCKITKSIKKYRVYVARGTYNEMIQLKKSKYSDSDAWVSKI